MTYDFSNRTAVITGASGGIGSECAKLFADDGADLVLIDLNSSALDRIMTELSANVSISPIVGDLTDEAVLAAIVSAARETGGVNYLVPAAGIYVDQAVESMSFEDWRRTLSINLDSVFKLTNALLPYLRNGGVIVNFASMAGSRGSMNHAPYSASKGALVSFGRSLARELGTRNIRVNAVAPGIISTTMANKLMATGGKELLQQTPLGRFGEPREVATVVEFLCSDNASFINGETIHINGGLYMTG